ncbi:asporin-like [Zophobas morio]
MAQLIQLDLQNNSLKKMNKQVFNNMSIWSFDFRNNHISQVEVGAFDGLYVKLDWSGTKLLLSNNKLEEINPDAFTLQDLRYLDLDNNSISRVRPGDLANLPNLLTLRLSGHKLQEIPNGVFNGSLIWFLDLSST